MAYALVGSIGTVKQFSGTTITPAFAQATTAGNLLIAWLGATGATLSVTGTGWTQAVDAAGGATGLPASIWYRANCGAGETAPSFSFASISNGWAVLGEFSGGETTSPVDQVGNGPQGNTSTPQTAACASADAQAGELLVSCSYDDLSKAGTVTTSDTYNNGATPTSNLNNDATSIVRHYRFAWGTTTGNSAADQNSHADNSMNLVGMNTCVASFKLPAAFVLLSQPCNLGNSPGMLMEAWKAAGRSWRKRRSGLVVPELWLPSPALA